MTREEMRELYPDVNEDVNEAEITDFNKPVYYSVPFINYLHPFPEPPQGDL